MTTMSQQTVTNRQLAASVRFGRRITISSPDLDEGEPLSGYVAGFDDETIFLAVPQDNNQLRKLLIHRDGYSHIELPDISTMKTETEIVRQQLTSLLGKFRDRIIAGYFPDRR